MGFHGRCNRTVASINTHLPSSRSSEGRESETRFMGPESRRWQGWFLLEALGENPFFTFSSS